MRMISTHNVRQLKQMLFRDDPCGHPDDKRALRFALHFLANLPKAPDAEVPYWRHVEYTDDGCSRYQCLACKNQWEGRDAPGWFDSFMEVDGKHPDANSYERTDGDGEPYTYYFVEREYPLYTPEWKYCPTCGIQWIGPIRCSVNNGNMLGPRRLRQQKAIDKRHDLIKYPYEYKGTGWWWVLQERTAYTPGERPNWADNWHSVKKYNPFKNNAVKIYDRLNIERSHIAAEKACNELRVVIMKHQETINLSICEGYC